MALRTVSIWDSDVAGTGADVHSIYAVLRHPTLGSAQTVYVPVADPRVRHVDHDGHSP